MEKSRRAEELAPRLLTGQRARLYNFPVCERFDFVQIPSASKVSERVLVVNSTKGPTTLFFDRGMSSHCRVLLSQTRERYK